MPKTLDGKVAIVTGGLRGIGAASWRGLAREGAAVVITYSSSKSKADEVVREIESAGGRGLAIEADSADGKAGKSAISETVKRFGQLDVLVNNAGIGKIAPLAEFSLEDF